MSAGGLSQRLMQVADRMVRHVSGGLGMVSVLSSMFFACLSGSAPATTATIGKIMIPEMEKTRVPQAIRHIPGRKRGAFGADHPPIHTVYRLGRHCRGIHFQIVSGRGRSRDL